MSHGIMENDTMFSVRERPWHGLGVILPEHPENIDDALEKAGLTWEVVQKPLYIMEQPPFAEEGFPKEVPGWVANTRTDTDSVLGIVTNDYRVVSNREAFAWLDTLLGTEVDFETAGSLYNGKRVWVLAKLPENVEVGGDEVQRFVYCANSHDGSMAVTAAATNIRVVCNNTLTWAIQNSAQRSYKFRHTGDLATKLDEARKVMSIALDWNAAFKELGDELASTPMPDYQFDMKVVSPLLDLKNTELGDRARANREEARGMLMDLFRGDGPNGDTVGNSPQTKWCAANAVAEYADWYRRYTTRTDQMSRSFEDSTLKQRGLELVVAA
jgi:phage/plasmid-like protein (TIGR03299 family)